VITTGTRKFVLLLCTLTLVAAPGFGADSGSPAQSPAPLPTGCWNLNANGSQGQLCIPSLESDGSFVGSMVFEGYSNVITGLWSSGAQQITFLRLGVPTNPLSYQSYTGFLFPADASNPTGSQMLTGSFSVFGPAGGSMQSRNFFGWIASHS
jgi:hypothetical protein